MKKVNGKRLIFIVIIGYIGVILFNQQLTMYRQKSDLKEAQARLEKVKQENSKLQDEEKMSHSESYIEKLAREKLGMIKQGETPVINQKEDTSKK